MGTTTTPNLGLIKPDGVEDGDNWPTQWSTNADILDALFPDAATYTPIFAGAGDNGTADEGSGGEAGRTGSYIQIGKLVVVWVRITFGSSGTSVPTGFIEISLPIEPDKTLMNVSGTGLHDTFYVGAVHFDNAGITADSYAGMFRIVDAIATPIAPNTAFRILRDTGAGSYQWSDFTGAEDEFISGFAAYVVA